jgi:UDP-N-acetylglucosamine--N-acetylmuramyl-(pentapeptide) pyrophosphoryl-undecaprenol N-acetylglucosamine transferase
VLVFGGSQGAKAINDAVIAAATQWENFHVVHQTGPSDFERVKQAHAGRDVDVKAFIDDMAAAYAACDVVVCRAGASSLAELALCGKPAVMIPLPTAADDHQTKNAQAFADAGAGVLLKQNELSGNKLAGIVADLLSDKTKLQTMSAAAKTLGDPKAAEHLAAMCLGLVKT